MIVSAKIKALYFERIGLQQVPKSAIVALGKMSDQKVIILKALCLQVGLQCVHWSCSCQNKLLQSHATLQRHWSEFTAKHVHGYKLIVAL